MNRASLLAAVAVALIWAPWTCSAQSHDSRMRSIGYEADRVYRLRGYVGYQIDLEFEPGEAFIGVGAGDLEGIGFAAQDNHLFIKPKAARVRTNLTVLTSRRSYHFRYEVLSAAEPAEQASELIFTLRFNYPVAPTSANTTLGVDNAEREFQRVAAAQAVNRDYWYCGSTALQPLAAFDDGVRTHLRFSPRRELPAVFVRNDDGSESLLNFNMQQGEMIIHRVAERLVIRRGKLRGCILNRSFDGTGRELRSGTVSAEIERATRGAAP
jgi:type IV secretion system protein VirB9